MSAYNYAYSINQVRDIRSRRHVRVLKFKLLVSPKRDTKLFSYKVTDLSCYTAGACGRVSQSKICREIST